MTTVEGNIDSLSRAIMAEAQAEIEDLKTQSQSKADAILQRARAAAEQQRAEIVAGATREARRLRDQATATSQLKARTLELEHREQLLQKVFDVAAVQLRESPTRKDYGQSVIALLREAVDQLRTKAVIVRADRGTRPALTNSVLDSVSAATGVELQLGEELQSGTGIVVQSPDGRLQFDNTLENRLERLQATLRAEVFRILTGDTK